MKILITLTLIAVTAFTLSLNQANVHNGIGDVRVGGFSQDTLVTN
jgi:hypothetical protein